MEYEEFMERYNRWHECCPECGATEHRSTLMGYIYNSDDPDSYKDENKCECLKCGDKHIRHDRVSDGMRIAGRYGENGVIMRCCSKGKWYITVPFCGSGAYGCKDCGGGYYDYLDIEKLKYVTDPDIIKEAEQNHQDGFIIFKK